MTGYGKWLHPQTSPANIPAAGVMSTPRHSTCSTVQLPGNWLHISDKNNFPMRLNHMTGDNLHHTASGTEGNENTARAVCTRVPATNSEYKNGEDMTQITTDKVCHSATRQTTNSQANGFEGEMTERFTLLLPQPICNTPTADNVNSAQAISPQLCVHADMSNSNHENIVYHSKTSISRRFWRVPHMSETVKEGWKNFNREGRGGCQESISTIHSEGRICKGGVGRRKEEEAGEPAECWEEEEEEEASAPHCPSMAYVSDALTGTCNASKSGLNTLCVTHTLSILSQPFLSQKERDPRTYNDAGVASGSDEGGEYSGVRGATCACADPTSSTLNGHGIDGDCDAHFECACAHTPTDTPRFTPFHTPIHTPTCSNILVHTSTPLTPPPALSERKGGGAWRLMKEVGGVCVRNKVSLRRENGPQQQ